MVAEKLADGGFPPRHVLRLADMHGPGLEKAEQLWPKVAGGDVLLILCGDRGPGKTQIATKWAALAAEELQACRPLYFKAHDLLTLIRLQFSDDRQEKLEAKKTLQAVRKRRFLVVDEFSELAGTEWEKKTLTNILDHRYDAMLSTVLITNHAPAAAAEAVGRSVWSRAEETGGVVPCEWASYRKGAA